MDALLPSVPIGNFPATDLFLQMKMLEHIPTKRQPNKRIPVRWLMMHRAGECLRMTVCPRSWGVPDIDYRSVLESASCLSHMTILYIKFLVDWWMTLRRTCEDDWGSLSNEKNIPKLKFGLGWINGHHSQYCWRSTGLALQLNTILAIIGNRNRINYMVVQDKLTRVDHEQPIRQVENCLQRNHKPPTLCSALVIRLGVTLAHEQPSYDVQIK